MFTNANLPGICSTFIEWRGVLWKIGGAIIPLLNEGRVLSATLDTTGLSTSGTWGTVVGGVIPATNYGHVKFVTNKLSFKD